MAAYYNEIEPFAAQWLRNLIAAGHIAPGDVDERSIADVKPDEIKGYTQCHFFAGIGIWSLALRRAGWSDSRSIWTGSCPCQPFSAAGKQRGTEDARHLWPEFFRLIKELGPPVVIGEQSSSKTAEHWIDLVQDDLEAENYAFGSVSFPACSVGAPHLRNRCYWVANSNIIGVRSERPGEVTSEARGMQNQEGKREWVWSNSWTSGSTLVPCSDGKRRPIEPGAFPVANGDTTRVARLRAYGNAIVAPQAQVFIEAIMECIP